MPDPAALERLARACVLDPLTGCCPLSDTVPCCSVLPAGEIAAWCVCALSLSYQFPFAIKRWMDLLSLFPHRDAPWGARGWWRDGLAGAHLPVRYNTAKCIPRCIVSLAMAHALRMLCRTTAAARGHCAPPPRVAAGLLQALASAVQSELHWRGQQPHGALPALAWVADAGRARRMHEAAGRIEQHTRTWCDLTLQHTRSHLSQPQSNSSSKGGGLRAWTYMDRPLLSRDALCRR
jgi:hypothetical protein